MPEPTRIFYSAWQFGGGAGVPFSVGDTVEWTVWRWSTSHDDEETAGIEWLGDHHGAYDPPTREVRGMVVAIRAVWFRYESDDLGGHALVHSHDSAVGVDVSSIFGTSGANALPLRPDYELDGWIVTIA